LFHDVEEIRELQGVGRLLKEEKVVDHRPRVEQTAKQVNGYNAPGNGNGHAPTSVVGSNGDNKS
jgi:hypothetical protein